MLPLTYSFVKVTNNYVEHELDSNEAFKKHIAIASRNHAATLAKAHGKST